jgi:GntR family transcriptional regulator
MTGRFHLVPLYTQVGRALRDRIIRGDWKANQLLPNENALASEYGVSSGTIRRALNELEEINLVLRRQGRGTFVIDQSATDWITRLSGIRDKQGRKPLGDLKTLHCEIVEADEEARSRLNIARPEEVIRCQRLHSIHTRPIMFETSTLVSHFFKDITQEKLVDYRLLDLARQHGVEVSYADEEIAAVMPTEEVAQILKIDANVPVLLLNRVSHVQDSGPVEWRQAWVHSGDFRYVARLQ